jgi:hypothetical protein
MYQSQKLQILNYLEKHKTINSFKCFIELQIVDLQHAIYELRKEGYNISDKWITKTNKKGKSIKYKEYRLEV